MLEGPDTHTIHALGAPDSVQELRNVIGRMQGELKFKETPGSRR